MALFTRDQLANYAQTPDLSHDTYVVVEQVVVGWLAQEGITVVGTPPPAVFSIALELGAIAAENPAALSSRSTDGVADVYSRLSVDAVFARAREYAAASGGGSAASSGSPLGSFPLPSSYPDPAYVRALHTSYYSYARGTW